MSLSETNIFISHVECHVYLAIAIACYVDVEMWGNSLLIAGCGPPYPTRPYASSTTDLAIATVFICLNNQLEESPASTS